MTGELRGLDDFLWARAEEIDDEDAAAILFELVTELREMDSPTIVQMARERAARWSDHPDFDPAWAV